MRSKKLFFSAFIRRSQKDGECKRLSNIFRKTDLCDTHTKKCIHRRITKVGNFSRFSENREWIRICAKKFFLRLRDENHFLYIIKCLDDDRSRLSRFPSLQGVYLLISCAIRKTTCKSIACVGRYGVYERFLRHLIAYERLGHFINRVDRRVDSIDCATDSSRRLVDIFAGRIDRRSDGIDRTTDGFDLFSDKLSCRIERPTYRVLRRAIELDSLI